MKLSLIFSNAFALVASAQSTSSYTDPKSSLTFQAFTDPSGYTFGLAISSITSTDFVGLLVGQSTGWAGVSLGGPMVNKLLIAAWADGTEVISSFRKASAYAAPPEATGSYTLTPIANGTYVNSTHFSLTFLCKGCIATDGSTFLSNATQAVLGWAMSSTPPANVADHTSALQYHNNFGNYGLDLEGARSAVSRRWHGYESSLLEKRKPMRFRGVSGLRIG